MGTNKEKLVRTIIPGVIGLMALSLSFQLFRHCQIPAYLLAAIIIAAMFLAMFVADACLCIQGRSGLIAAPCRRAINPKRIVLKIVGLSVTVAIVSFPYWIFPEYLDVFYTPYFQALKMGWPYLWGIFIFFIVWEDPRAEVEHDAYYYLAHALICFKFNSLKKVNLKQHFLGWVVKLFFLPLMFVYLVNYVTYFTIPHLMGSYNTIYNIIFIIDTAFVCVGYIFANNLIDTQIRSTEPTVLGWACTLICYNPFWLLIGSRFISYGSSWGIWLGGYPQIREVWFILIVLSWILYVWATISFGSRFSNLTHRGIIACGPYAYMKHPAYIGKMISFFLTSVPFVADNLFTAVRYCLMWGLLAGIYYLRAKTEEAHLRSVGPEYDMYAQEIKQNWKKLLRIKEL